jgi:glutamate-1-semialdehyde 2,1-aminomutase
MLSFFFTNEREVTSFSDLSLCSIDRFNRLFHGLLQSGYYFAPSAYEALFVSACHTMEELTQTAEKVSELLRIEPLI